MDEEQEQLEKSELKRSVWYALLLTALPWAVHIFSEAADVNLRGYGLIPLNITGLRGILTLPFLHADWEHLISNTPALFLLLFGLFLFYGNRSAGFQPAISRSAGFQPAVPSFHPAPTQAWRILLYLYLLSGALTWLMGRHSTHIGASGLVYALAAFHFTSGVIKREPRQRAFALLVAFLYGSFVWAFFPTLYLGSSVSWEGHLSGLLAGILFAFYYRTEGPKPPANPFLDEDEETVAESEEAGITSDTSRLP